MVPLNFGLRRELYAIAALLAFSERETIPHVSCEAAEAADLRMTAIYRKAGGAFVVSARRATYAPEPFLHVAVVENGTTGGPHVFHWTGSGDTLMPPTTIPNKAVGRLFEAHRGERLEDVVKHVLELVGRHLAAQIAKHARRARK
jgi:hypothetical protein